ncbi:hypothetical protein P7C70_g1750, partial [Phenoliferia sp. Uapishka_3]
MTKLTLSSTLKLKSGGSMPVLGFGVYQSTAAPASASSALDNGYRHIDSARIYRNEAEVVSAVSTWRKSGGAGDVWLTSKVVGKEHATGKCDAAVDESVERAKAGGLQWDLFLLHDPTAGPEKRLQAWRVLEDAVIAGKLKAIGVSNFSDVHLEEFKAAGVKLTPEVNQIELHPWCQQKPIVEYCKAAGIIIQAYCPIVRGQRMEDPVLKSVCEKSGKTGAQVLIRWSLQKGYVPLPKSDTPSRIAENADVFDFELDGDSMSKLDALDLGKDGACSWNPVGHI